MDQALDPRIHIRKRRLRALAVVAVLASVAVSAFGLNRLIRPSVSAHDVTIAVVQPGVLASTISASGTVIPVHEEMVTSPVTTRVAKVVAKPGKQVAQGELLLQLDDKDLRLAVDSLHEQLAQQENRVAMLTQELEQKRKQLMAAIELLQLDLRSAEAKWQRFQKLRSSGAVSGEDLLTAELNVQRIQVQLRQQQEQIEDSKRSTRTAIDGALLQKAILQKQLAQQEHQLAQAQVRAPFAGVLTWLSEEEGATVNAGQVVARVSEMNNYKVEATLSDFHAHSVAAGQAARVEQSGQSLTGRVQTVLPEIQNGTMKVLITLDQPHHALLRNKLRVETWIVTSDAAQTLVVSTGPAINGTGHQPVWVIAGDRAVKRELQIGASDGKSVAIAAGARPGERLIVSDMSRYKDLDTLRFTE